MFSLDILSHRTSAMGIYHHYSPCEPGGRLSGYSPLAFRCCVVTHPPKEGCDDCGQLPRTLIARAPTTTIVASEIALSTIMSILAREVSGVTSVVLNAVAVE